MAEAVGINDNQREVLKQVVSHGKVNLVETKIDKRSVNALESKGLVKVKETAKGTFVSATAKGKKVS